MCCALRGWWCSAWLAGCVCAGFAVDWVGVPGVEAWCDGGFLSGDDRLTVAVASGVVFREGRRGRVFQMCLLVCARWSAGGGLTAWWRCWRWIALVVALGQSASVSGVVVRAGGGLGVGAGCLGGPVGCGCACWCALGAGCLEAVGWRGMVSVGQWRAAGGAVLCMDGDVGPAWLGWLGLGSWCVCFRCAVLR